MSVIRSLLLGAMATSLVAVMPANAKTIKHVKKQTSYSARHEPMNILPPEARFAVPAVVGTVAGVGTYNGWWAMHGITHATRAAAVAGSAAVGVVAFSGTLVGYDMLCKSVGYDFLNLQLGNRCSWRE